MTQDAAASATFIEVGHYQARKHAQSAGGDAFFSQKGDEDGRVITALSDGLGSGIKAGVLATLTATMAMKFVALDIPIRRAANIIMNTLPVCKDRGISYATFTLVDVGTNTPVRIMEYDNPGYVLLRQRTVIEPIKQRSRIERKNLKHAPNRDAFLDYSEFDPMPGDRLVFFSDGVTQAGMGTRQYPMGWGIENVQRYLTEETSIKPDVSARDLARDLVREALARDGYRAMDDITCGVVYFRSPRDLLIMTGPPVNPERDAEMAHEFTSFRGRKIVCGGTTANILARQLKRPVRILMRELDPKIPPMSEMEGADLVTEGIITLGCVAETLERACEAGGNLPEAQRQNGATRIIEAMLDSDRITFLLGTRINEAHQDLNMPEELEIRRNIVKKIRKVLAEHYLKEVTVRYI